MLMDFASTTPDLPPELWWLPLVTLILLALAALIDTVKGIVPDILIFLGMVFVIAAQGFGVSWDFAAHHLTWALVVAFVIWGINYLWHRFFRHDAIGMGDAKWSMLAVACFGALPVLYAWGVGAVLALIWMGTLKLCRRPIAHVHFAPFLLLGLGATLYARVTDLL